MQINSRLLCLALLFLVQCEPCQPNVQHTAVESSSLRSALLLQGPGLTDTRLMILHASYQRLNAGALLELHGTPTNESSSQLTIKIGLNSQVEGPWAATLQGSVCVFTRQTADLPEQVDYFVSAANGTTLEDRHQLVNLQLDIQCQKIMKHKLDGKPYGENFPTYIHVVGEIAVPL